MRLLYIIWDGPGTTYHETLFLPLLERSISPDDQLALLQFSWGAEERVQRLAALASERGIGFEHRRVRRGLGIVALPVVLFSALVWMVRRTRDGTIDTVLARSMIPGGLAVAWTHLARAPSRFIFDADGLPADERLEFGGWRHQGLRYRVFRWLERSSVRNAAAVLVRSAPAAAILRERSGCDDERFVVIVNGKDPSEFRPATSQQRKETRSSVGLALDQPVLVHVGSLGPQYEPGFMLEILRQMVAEQPGTQLLALTARTNHDALLHAAGPRLARSIIAKQADPADVPALLAAADIGLAFRRPSFSQRAVAPIKIAEYLLCGLPIVFSSGIGDLDALLDSSIGFAVTDSDHVNARRVARWIIDEGLPDHEELSRRARALGVARFSLDAGAEGYRRAFARLEGR